ncbi:MAG: hypothetical protein ACOCSQ_02145 [Planctomycetota bacterium]
MSKSIERMKHCLKPSGDVPVMGISEFQNWYQHYDYDIPELKLPVDEPEKSITDCIDVHLQTGMNNIVWSCGRSTLHYRSDLERATPQGTDSIKPILDQICPLRTAMEYANEKDVAILGRLAMNRHYRPERANCSEFARNNPQFMEKGKLGDTITHRLCYAFDEVQRERIDILLEIQRLGVDALVLDYCRQMPVLLYHDALVEPYLQKKGVDPREIHSTDPEDHADWFQYRADVLTGFMEKLRMEVAEQEKELGRDCPVIARVPDSAPWLMIAYGLDVERWCRDDLVDGIMLSPFPRTIEDLGLYPEYHIETAHKYDKYVIGGIGSLNLMRSKGNGNQLENSGFYHDKPAFQKAARQYNAGADAMSLYQTETLARLRYLHGFIAALGDREQVARNAEQLDEPDRQVLFRNNSSVKSIGLDWHTSWHHPLLRGGESLSTWIAGNSAL